MRRSVRHPSTAARGRSRDTCMRMERSGPLRRHRNGRAGSRVQGYHKVSAEAEFNGNRTPGFGQIQHRGVIHRLEEAGEGKCDDPFIGANIAVPRPPLLPEKVLWLTVTGPGRLVLK